MKKTLLAALTFAALLLPPAAYAAAPDAPPVSADDAGARWLADNFGLEGRDALKAKGYVVLQGKKDAGRLQFVHWKAFEALSRRGHAALELAGAYTFLGSGSPVSITASPAFLPLTELPATGLVTPALHVLIDALAAYHQAWTSLYGAAGPEGAKSPGLYDTPWGKRFLGRTHGDTVEDAKILAKPFFEEMLAGVRREPEAQAHFQQYISSRYKTDVGSMLAADATSGDLSEELRGWLRKYLEDQRRLLVLEQVRKGLEALEKKENFTKDLKTLESVARVLKDKPSLLSELEALPKQSAAGKVKLTTAGLHLQQPTRLGQFELGDSVMLSGAYWVDGLPEGKSAEIEETTLAETPRGAGQIETKLVKRANGGPYTFSRAFRLRDSAPFLFRSILSSPESNVLSDSLEVPVSRDFETAALKLAAADQQALSCAFKEAEALYAKPEETVAEAAKEKPQYRELVKDSQQRRQAAAKDAADLVKLEEAMAASRADGSPETCQYKTQRTEAAIAMVRRLPAGCDKHLAALDAQLAMIRRRASDQDAFAKAQALAASRAKSCDFGLAVEQAGRGLAILEADPAARCGKTAEEAKQLEEGLGSLRAEELWRIAFGADLKDAEAEASPRGRLATLNPLIARIASRPNAACFSKERAKAETLSAKAGEALQASEALAKGLAADGGLAATLAEVSAERAKLVSADATAQGKKAEEQSPVAVAAEAETAKPAVKTKAAPGSKARLDCLEAGFKEHGATVDCNAQAFDIRELKSLRDKFEKKTAKKQSAKKR